MRHVSHKFGYFQHQYMRLLSSTSKHACLCISMIGFLYVEYLISYVLMHVKNKIKASNEDWMGSQVSRMRNVCMYVCIHTYMYVYMLNICVCYVCMCINCMYILLTIGAGDSWHSLRIIYPRYCGWSGSNKKKPPMGLRADSFECDVTRLIWGLWLYFRNQIAQKESYRWFPCFFHPHGWSLVSATNPRRTIG